MRFTFPWPAKPWRVSQEWGIFNPAYQRFGFTRHNGIDIALGNDKLVRSPFAGTVIRAATLENGEWQPNGGGIFISVISDREYDFDDGQSAYVLVDFLHCERIIVQHSEKVLLGTVLAIGGNTGFSTGPHTHVQLRRCRVVPGGDFLINEKKYHLEWLDQNDANGSFDPTPYLTSTYAEDDLLTGYVKTTGLTWLLKFFTKGR
jgi:murein DD-endopeptidase MepM/ murein hydrolase activator NlpD